MRRGRKWLAPPFVRASRSSPGLYWAVRGSTGRPKRKTAGVLLERRPFSRCCELSGPNVASDADGGGIDQVLGEEPDLELIGADDLAHEQVVGAIVAGFLGLLGHGAGFAEKELVRFEKA